MQLVASSLPAHFTFSELISKRISTCAYEYTTSTESLREKKRKDGCESNSSFKLVISETGLMKSPNHGGLLNLEEFSFKSATSSNLCHLFNQLGLTLL